MRVSFYVAPALAGACASIGRAQCPSARRYRLQPSLERRGTWELDILPQYRPPLDGTLPTVTLNLFVLCTPAGPGSISRLYLSVCLARWMLNPGQQDVGKKRAFLLPPLQHDECVDLSVGLDYLPPPPDENQHSPCGRLLPKRFGRDCLTA